MPDFIYQKQIAPCGIAVEEIYGADEKTPKVWKLFAIQIFSEAEGDYRDISHFDNGAPFLEGIPRRISVSHTPHHLAVASLPKTSDINLDEVNIRTAIGIDIEKADRSQVLKIIDKFLTPAEQALLPQHPAEIPGPTSDSPQSPTPFILAWTCKEALYKSVMGLASDWKEDYQIISLPLLAKDINDATKEKYGKAIINLPEPGRMEMLLSSWLSEGHVVTLAFSSKIPIYK